MRRHLALLLTLPALAACEIDLTEPLSDIDWCLISCSGGFGPPPPSVFVTGLVWVGEYLAFEGETQILLYVAPDTLVPVDSIPVLDGHYFRGFGATPTPEICGYLARAVLWSGESTGLERLFPTTGQCQATSYGTTGPTFDLPAYAPLSTPFVVRGRVLVDGQPAPGDVQIRPSLRIARTGSQPPYVTTDVNGHWSFEVVDAAQRFGLCAWAGADVYSPATGRSDYARLDSPTNGICDTERVLPDVRFGTRKAAVVQVYRETSPGMPARVGAGEAKVSLAMAADSSAVGDEFTTLDDGVAHVWFPDDMENPGCAFLLRVELDGAVQHHPLVPPGETGCRENYYRFFQFIGI